MVKKYTLVALSLLLATSLILSNVIPLSPVQAAAPVVKCEGGWFPSAPPKNNNYWAWVKPPCYPYPTWDSGNPFKYYFGQCTWWGNETRKDENFDYYPSGNNADRWVIIARLRHYPVYYYKPKVGATIVFPPHFLGAGSLGHVAHVEKVYANGWYVISEMNFQWNGGGWGIVDYRFMPPSGKIAFIY